MQDPSAETSQSSAAIQALAESDSGRSYSALSQIGYYLLHERMLSTGLFMLIAILALWLVGGQLVDPKLADPISGPQLAEPQAKYWLGTDFNGRQILPLMIHGAPLTLRIGLYAGIFGLGIGIILGFLAGYMRGATDAVIRVISDVFITIPSLAVLVVVASTLKGGSGLSVNAMGFIVASLSWMWPTRVIRAQVLSMRESNYVEVARLNGMGDFEIIFRELMPNLLPFLAASFVGAMASGILAAVGLEALGLGPQSEPTLGMTVYWSIYYGALLSNWWWWYVPPIILLAWIFVTLYLIASGLDKWANPRLRQSL